MDEGKRAQWLLLHDIWGRSLTRVNPFTGSWVKTGDDPQYAANHSAWGFSRRSRSAKCELTKCKFDCEDCYQEMLVYPEVGPKCIQLTVDTSALLSDDEDLVELAIELLATLDGLKHRPPIKGEDEDALNEALHIQFDVSSYNEEVLSAQSAEEETDRYLDQDDPIKVLRKSDLPEGTHRAPDLGLAPRIITADEWIEAVDREIEKAGTKYWRSDLGFPAFREVHVVTAKTEEYVPVKVKPDGLKLYDWMCPAVVELRAKFPTKGILRKTTPGDPSKVKPIPCGMPVKQDGVMRDPNYK
jgi:hypothetical protein